MALEKNTLATRLATGRVPEQATVSGKRLLESAGYIKQARLALLLWTREVYASTDQVDRHTDEVIEVLSMTRQLETLRMRLDAKASVLGA